MSEFRRRVGNSLGLHLSLKPADDSLYVRAYLYDKDGTALSPPTVDLPNVGSGSYLENSRNMPSTPQVRVDYRVYEDAAFTIESCEYLGDTDYFDLDDSPQTATQIVGKLTGVLSGPRLKGIMSQQPDLTGILSSKKTKGVLSSNRLKGVLSTRRLTGIIEC